VTVREMVDESASNEYPERHFTIVLSPHGRRMTGRVLAPQSLGPARESAKVRS
jgi:hypothetical protein